MPRNEFFQKMRGNITRNERNNNNIKVSLSQTDERFAGRMYSLECSAERTLNPRRITHYSLPSFEYALYSWLCVCDSDDNAIITDFYFLVEEPNETEHDAGSTNLLPLSLSLCLCLSHLLGHASHFARLTTSSLQQIIFNISFYHSNTDVDSSELVFYFCFFDRNQNSFYKHTMNDVWLRAPMATNIEKTCLHTTRQHLFASSFSFARNCQLHVRRTKTGVAGQRRRKNPPSIGINNVQRSQQLTEEPQIFIFLLLIFE